MTQYDSIMWQAKSLYELFAFLSEQYGERLPAWVDLNRNQQQLWLDFHSKLKQRN